MSPRAYLSADGTERCTACGLHPCDCTCGSDLSRLLFGLVLYGNGVGPAPEPQEGGAS